MIKAYFLSIFFTLYLPFTVFSQNLRFVEKDGVITLYDQESPRFTYQKETKSLNGEYPRANYVHPLYDLNGDILTEDFPEDHLHHRGIFWTWHQLYVKDRRIADPWFCEGIQWKVDAVTTNTSTNSATLEAIVYWISTNSINQDNEEDTVLQEHVKITYAKPEANYFQMDFEIKLTPLVEDVKIGGSEDEKGYGGFSVRVKTPENLAFYAQKGRITPQNTPVEANGWVNITGSFNPDKKGQAAVVIMCEPSELESFQGWILRKKDSMQNPAFPGREPISISKEKPLIFKNRILVHQGNLSSQEIAKKYISFE